MTTPIILGKSKRELLADIGTALLQVKNARQLTLSDMADSLGRSDEMLAQYIAGEAEMGVTAWLRANDAWPELIERVSETAAERAMRARQRALDLDPPKRAAA